MGPIGKQINHYDDKKDDKIIEVKKILMISSWGADAKRNL